MVKSGSVVKALRRIEFCDGTFHYKNQIITITDETRAYYELFVGKEYQLIQRS